MPRTAADIDAELKRAVDRRSQSRARISCLSQAVVQDTRLIDLLLAERAEKKSSPV